MKGNLFYRRFTLGFELRVYKRYSKIKEAQWSNDNQVPTKIFPTHLFLALYLTIWREYVLTKWMQCIHFNFNKYDMLFKCTQTFYLLNVYNRTRINKPNFLSHLPTHFNSIMQHYHTFGARADRDGLWQRVQRAGGGLGQVECRARAAWVTAAINTARNACMATRRTLLHHR